MLRVASRVQVSLRAETGRVHGRVAKFRELRGVEVHLSAGHHVTVVGTSSCRWPHTGPYREGMCVKSQPLELVWYLVKTAPSRTWWTNHERGNQRSRRTQMLA
jgi:hypothetical protein